MSDLSIRRELNIATRFEKLAQAEKPAGAAQSQSAAQAQGTAQPGKLPQASSTLAPSLQQLLETLDSPEQLAQANRELLQTGEGALAEARDILERMSKLAQQAQQDGADRTALQKEYKQLLGELDRVLQNANYEGEPLFQGEDFQTYETLLDDLERLLGGTAQTTAGAGAQQGGVSAEKVQQLLAQLTQGVPLDQALQSLTGASGNSLLALMDLFGGEGGEQLMSLLTALLSGDGQGAATLLGDAATLTLLSALDGSKLNMLVSALASRAPEGAQAAGAQPQAGQADTTQQFGQFQAAGQDLSGVSYDPSSNTLTVTGQGDVTILGGQQPGQAQQAGQAQAEGQSQAQPTIVLSGSGQVKMQNVEGGRLVVAGQEARVYTVGENTLGEVRMEPGAWAEFGGEGLLEAGKFTADASNHVTLTGGAVSVGRGQGSLEGAQVYMSGCASLAAQAQTVRTAGGQAEPFDVLWKALLPGWKQVDAMVVDGQQTQLSLYQSGERMSAARLWLDRGTDPSHGHPIHSLTIMGRDEADEQQIQSVWLCWDETYGGFRQVIMYPNPFTITGGEQGVDWTYEEGTQTLRILTHRVVAVSGGEGLDAQQQAFSGRLAIADNLGPLELTLGGLTCQALAGRAFDLGRENHVTLLLLDGTSNSFESGEGCAGVSLGDGTSLTIDATSDKPEESGGDEPEGSEAREEAAAPPPAGENSEEAGSERPVGSLSARGGDGGAGIGRDSGGSWDRISKIVICGGEVYAEGAGGGAGIGAGRYGFMGDVVITGGVVTAVGGPGGGAGIGGALGAPVGDITIQGGDISATAVYQAAAIGAGVEGECGDVYVSADARILNAQGGDPGYDIGPCRFGKCGQVRVETDEGPGIAVGFPPRGDEPLPDVGEVVRLPRFVITPRMLRLRNLDLSSFEAAWAAEGTINAASRHIQLVEGIYHALGGRVDAPLRTVEDADELLGRAQSSIRRTSPEGAMRLHSGRKGREALLQLLSQQSDNGHKRP